MNKETKYGIISASILLVASYLVYKIVNKKNEDYGKR
jgi:hypothetical protein